MSASPPARFVSWRLCAIALSVAAMVLTVEATTHAASAAPVAAAGPAAGEAELQGRLIAPCCWQQTLDVHESEISTQLRQEIRNRLHAGESAQKIEDDLAARYGERIRAVPRGKDPFGTLAIGALAAILASAFGLGFVVWRWTRSAPGNAAGPPVCGPGVDQAADDELDARLDAELRQLDEA